MYVPSTAEIEIYKVYLYFEPSLHLHSFERLNLSEGLMSVMSPSTKNKLKLFLI